MANNNFLSSPFDSVAVSSEFTDTPPAQVETPKPKATAAVVTPRVSAPSKNDLIARANELGVDPNLALSFFSQESSGNWNSKDSPKGARGGMQVMPGTFKMMMGTAAGQDDPWQNMEAGLRYIRYGQTKLKTKDPELLAAGYHAGYDNPSLARGQIPNTNDGMINTRDYAKSVAGRLGKSSKTASIDDEFSDTPPKLTDADFSDTPVTVDKSNNDAWDVEFAKQKVDTKPYWDRLKDETKAGFGDMVRSIDTARWALGSGDDTDIAKQIADNIQAQAKTTKNKSQQEIDAAYKQVTDAKGVIDTTAAGAKALYTSITNPSETFIEVARNAANALPTIGAGAAGAGAGAAAGSVIPGAGTALGAVLGGRAGMVAGTTATELGAEIQDMIGKRLESNNQAPTAQNVLAIIRDQKFKEEARKQGLAKGLTVAAVDQVFFGIGGKVATAPARKLATRDLAAQGVEVSTRAARNQALSSAAGQTALQAAKPSIAARAGAGAAAIGIDAGGETLGEGLSQKVARGEVDYGDALREGVTSLGQSAVEVGISAATQGYRAGAQAAKSVVQPTKSEAAGPLARAAENAAVENERVTVTAPTGEQVTGEITGKAEDGTTQVTTDDGQQVTFKVGENGITMEPEAPNTPLSNAVEAAAIEQPEAKPAAPVVEAVAPVVEATAPEDTTGLASMGKGMASAITDNLYGGLYKALQNGESKFAGIKDPVLAKAKPYYDAGLINSANDLRKFENDGYPALPKAEAQPVETIERPAAPAENGVRRGRDERYGIDVELSKDGDGFTLTETDAQGNRTAKKITTGYGGVYLGNRVLNQEGEFVPASQIVQAGNASYEKTPFRGTTEQRNAVVALVAEIEFARSKGDMAKVEQLEKQLFDIASGKQEQLAPVAQENATVAPQKDAPTETIKRPAPQAKVDYKTMSEPELKSRLDYLKNQAKTNGGWNKLLYTERRAVENAISKLPKPDETEVKQFAPETGTLGVPRAEMPQVKSEHHGALVNHLNAQGIAHETTRVDAATLKPTQAEYSPAKVERAKEEGNGERSIIVSSDNHIIDGHHQAVAAAEKGEQVKAIVLDASAEKALEAVKAFPSATTEGKPQKASKEDINHLFGLDEKRAKALERIAAGRAWFNDGVKAKDFIKKNDLTDTHEAKKGKGGRWDIVAKRTDEDIKSLIESQAESLAVSRIAYGEQNMLNNLAEFSKENELSLEQQRSLKEAADKIVTERNERVKGAQNVNDQRTEQQPNGREEGQRTEAAAPAAVQSDAAQEVAGAMNDSWRKEFERAKREGDMPALDNLYGKVKIALNGVAQGQGDAVTKQFESLKADMEKYAQEVNEKRENTKYHVVAVNDKTGDATRMTNTPVTEREGNTIISKNTERPGRTLQLEEVKAEATVTDPAKAKEGDIIETGGVKFRKTATGFERVADSKPKVYKRYKAEIYPYVKGDNHPILAEKNKVSEFINSLSDKEYQSLAAYVDGSYYAPSNFDGRFNGIIGVIAEPDKLLEQWSSFVDSQKEQPKTEAKRRPQPGEDGYTLDMANEDLDSHYEQKRRNGMIEDARLNDRIALFEKLVDDMQREAEQPTEPTPPKGTKADPFAGNKLFTADKVAAARARLKSKLTQLNSGIDPEVLVDGLTISGAYIESGVREFGEYAKRMISDFGNEITPFLLSFWEAARNYPGIDNKDMTSVRESARAHAAMMEKPAAAANVEPVKESDDGNTNTAPSAGSAGDRALEGKPAEDVPSAEAVGNAEQSGNGSGAENTGRAGNADRKRNTPRGRVGNGAGDVSVPAGRARSQRGSTQQSGLFDQPPAEQADQRDVEVKQARESKPAGANYKITDLTKLGEGGQKTKYRNNVAAIKLLNELQEAGRQATAEEQDTLARYVGWGGLAQAFDAANSEWSKEHAELKELLTPEEWESAKESTQYAHYTSQEIIGGIYDALKRFGFGGGTALEPGSGVGNFMGMLPDALRGNTRFTAVERERIAGGIAKLLYPNHNVQQEDFRSFNAQDGYFDVAIGNPPFSATTLTDLTGRKHLSGLSIHNYFFAKSIDMLREGGVLAMVVSNSFMDAKTDRARKYIGDRAELLGAIRLPNNAFAKNANTEVTTDIIFLKKRPESEWGSRAAKEDMRRWVDIGSISDPRGGESIPVNRYFIDNPSMMLGRMERSGSMYRADAPALVAREGQDTASLLKQAIQNLPEGVYEAVATANTAKMEDAAIEKLSDKATVDVGGHYVDGDKLYVRMPDVAGEGRAMQLTATTKISEKKDLGKNGLDRLKSLAQMRVTLRSLLSAELKDASNMESLRKQLNTEYDAYVKQFGYINQRGTIQLYGDDPDFPLLASLELSYDPGISRAAAEKQGVKAQEPSAKKAAIFKQRVIPKYEEVTSAETPEDALFVSIAERGQIDAAYIGKLLGQDGEAVLKDLASQKNPSVFIDPATGGYALKDAYLSGNVRKKMEQAKAAGMFQNVAALEAVIPEDIPAHEISGKIGAPWVPVETYEEFAKTIMGEGTTAKITYVPALSSYVANFAPGSDVANKNTYGTSRMGADEIMSALLNSKEIKVGHYEEEPGGGRRFVLEKEPTDEANDKAREIKDKFADWLFADGERSEKLQRAYNDAVNNYVTREFDGSMLKFPGKVPDSIIKLRRHQRNAVARIVQDGRALLDHVVGAGKAGSLDSKLLTPDGWVRMGDIKVGDYVISHDGTPTLVEAIFPQGDKEIFKVIFSDGSSTECCDEHLWLTWNYQERSYSQRMLKLGKQWECGMPKVRPLSEIRQTLVSDHLGAKNHSIPMVQPVQFNERHIPLDPYLVGALIGDGHIGEKAVSISGADDEVFYELNLPEGVRARENGDKTRCKSLHLVGTVPGKNPALDALRELGLTGKLSHEKFVPDAYKFNTADIRLAVLRGLMDTDGWVEKAGKTTAFTTVSRQLADDVTFLVQSFGGVALLTEKRPKYSHKGEKRDGRVAYRLTIKMPADINPFHISRKRDAVVAKTSYAPARYIVSVESIGMKPAQCIRVEHPSHLYVTDDFIVTHNTYTVIAAAMELKRTGLAKKPMIAVPNHLVKQWAADFYRLYPGANILTATKKDFERANRRKFLAKIATGNWDAVIMAHSSFGFIKPEPEFEIRFNAERVSEIIEAMQALKDEKDQNSKRTVKQLAKMKEGLENKLASLRDRPMDDLLDFGQIGVDQLFVDEAHLFKNLMYVTKMQNVRGLGQAKGSQRAYDMFIKTHQLYDNSENGRGVVFATGTPVSNSLAEMYHMLRYLAPETLKDSGQFTFDAWAKTFADVEQVWMQSLSGDGYKASNRMSVFANTPELLKVFDQVADTVTIDDIKKAYAEENGGKEFPIPPLKGGRRTPVSIPKSAAQNAYMAEIGERAKKLEQRKGKPQKGDDNMLSIMGDARKAAMDIRMVRPDITQRDPEGRIAVAARNVYDRYVKYNDVRGTQLIFSDMGTPKKSAEKELKEYNDLMAETAPLRDERVQAMADLGDESALDQIEKAEEAQRKIDAKGQDWADAIKMAMRGFSIYDDMKDALIELGIPENEIAFIHDYNTDDQKAALFRAVNDGKVRVLLGSTEKMGAGTNVQERAVALHHLDVPWKPSDIEQREGRVIRQGNSLINPDSQNFTPGFEVEVMAYATQDTLDLFMWQTQEKKLSMIGQLRTGNVGREVDNAFEEMQMSAGEMQAAATSNPYLLEEIQLKDRIKKLERQKRSFDGQKNDLANRLAKAQRDIEQLPDSIKKAEGIEAKAMKATEDMRADFKSMTATVNGETITGAMDIRSAVREAVWSAPEIEKDGKTVRDIKIEFNGKEYKSESGVSEAVIKALGDAAEASFTLPDGTKSYRGSETAAALFDTVSSMQDGDEKKLGSIGAFDVVAYQYQGVREANLELDGTSVASEILPKDLEMLLGRLRSMPVKFRDALNQQRGVPDYLRSKLEAAKRAKAEIEAMPAAGAWEGEKDLKAARDKYKDVLRKLAERESNTGGAPAMSRSKSSLEDIFAGLASDGDARTRAEQALDNLPDADKIRYIESNFYNILGELEDSGLVDIKC